MATKGSRWWCGLCHVAVTIAYQPKRLKHVICGKWMVKVWPREMQ